MNTPDPTPSLAKTYRVPPAADVTGAPEHIRADAEAAERRLMAITGLRNLAQMLVDHPELPTPYSITAQAGPATGIDWEAGRQFVLDVAEAIGRPLDTDTETAATLYVPLNAYQPAVRYTVHHGRDLPTEDTPRRDSAAGERDPGRRAAWDIVRRTDGLVGDIDPTPTVDLSHAGVARILATLANAGVEVHYNETDGDTFLDILLTPLGEAGDRELTLSWRGTTGWQLAERITGETETRSTWPLDAATADLAAVATETARLLTEIEPTNPAADGGEQR